MFPTGSELIDALNLLQRAGVQPGWHVADLGCGSLGHFVFPAAQIVGHDGLVYAVDVQKPVLRSIEQRAKAGGFWNVRPVWSDIETRGATRIPSASVDLALVANNLSCLQDRDAAIAEAVRLIKPGGAVLIVEWKKGKTLFGPPDEHRLSAEEIQALFQEPTVLVGTADAGDYHFAHLYQNR